MLKRNWELGGALKHWIQIVNVAWPVDTALLALLLLLLLLLLLFIIINVINNILQGINNSVYKTTSHMCSWYIQYNTVKKYKNNKGSIWWRGNYHLAQKRDYDSIIWVVHDSTNFAGD